MSTQEYISYPVAAVQIASGATGTLLFISSVSFGFPDPTPLTYQQGPLGDMLHLFGGPSNQPSDGPEFIWSGASHIEGVPSGADAESTTPFAYRTDALTSGQGARFGFFIVTGDSHSGATTGSVTVTFGSSTITLPYNQNTDGTRMWVSGFLISSEIPLPVVTVTNNTDADVALDRDADVNFLEGYQTTDGPPPPPPGGRLPRFTAVIG